MALPSYLQDDTTPVDTPSYLQEPTPVPTIPPPIPPPTPEAKSPGLLDFASVGLRGLTKVPGAVAATTISAIQGQSGVEAPGQGDIFEERIVRPVARGLRKFEEGVAQKFPESTAIQTLSRLPAGLGFSVPSAATGITAGLLTSPTEAIPGGQALPFIAGGAAAGATAFRASSSEIMRSYIDVLDEEKRASVGIGLTPQETAAARDDFSAKATEVGLWEALPEAVGGAVAGRLIFSPLKKMVGERVATSMAVRIGGVFGEELLTETITQIGQSQALAGTKLGGDEAPLEFTPSGALQALKEVAPDTLLLTAVMGGGMSAGQTIHRRRQEKKLAVQLGINREDLVSRVGDLLEAKQANPDLDIGSQSAMDFLSGSVVVEEGEFAQVQPTPEGAPVDEVVTPEPKKKPTKKFTRLEDVPNEVRYNARGVDYAYTIPENLTKQEVESSLTGLSDAAAFSWLERNIGNARRLQPEEVQAPTGPVDTAGLEQDIADTASGVQADADVRARQFRFDRLRQEVQDDITQPIRDQAPVQEGVAAEQERAEDAITGVEAISPDTRTDIIEQPVRPDAVEQRTEDVAGTQVVAPIQARAEVTPLDIATTLGQPEAAKTQPDVVESVKHFVTQPLDNAKALRITADKITAKEAAKTTPDEKRLERRDELLAQAEKLDIDATINAQKIQELGHVETTRMVNQALAGEEITAVAAKPKPKLTPIAKSPPTELEIKRQAKELAESTTTEDIEAKVQELFGATFEEFEARDAQNPQRGTDLQLDIADDFMADIQRAANDRNIPEAEALISQAYAAGLGDTVQEAAGGLRAVEPGAAVGDVQPRAGVQAPVAVPEGAVLTAGVQEVADTVDTAVRFDGESEGVYYFTPSEGPSAGRTFTVTSPTKANIEEALTTSQQTPTGEQLEAETTTEAEATPETREEAAEFATAEPEAVFEAVDKKLKAGQEKVDTAVKALAKPQSRLYQLFIQTAPAWLSVAPLHTLVQTFGKTIPQIKNFARHLDAVVAGKTDIVDTSAVNQDDAESLAEKGVGVDVFNRAAATASFNRMTPWDGILDQEWVPVEGTKEARLKAAQTSWVASKMQQATGLSFLQAHAEAADAYKALKTPALKEAYIKIVEHIASIRARERNNLLAHIESVSEEGSELRKDLMVQFEASFSDLYGAYWPLSRVGNYILEYVNARGERVVNQFTTTAERVAKKAELLESGIDQSTIKEDFKDLQPKGSIAIPPILMGQLSGAVQAQSMEGVDPNNEEAVAVAEARSQAIVNDMNQIWLRWQPDTAALKNSVERKNVKGFSDDMLRSYLDYMQRHASSVAWSEQGKKIENDIQSLADDIAAQKAEGGVDVTMQRHLLNDMRNRIHALQSVSVGPVASTLGKLSTGYYMTSPSIALVQMSQLAVLTFPKLAVKYGIGKATKAMNNGVKDAFTRKFTRDAMFGDVEVNLVYDNLRDVVTDENRNTPQARGKALGDRLFSDEQLVKAFEKLSPYQQKLLTLRESMARNLLDISAAHEAYELTRGKDPKSLRNKIFNLAMMPMSLSELTSRKSTVLATLELSQNEGKNFFESMTDIADAVNDTLYSYSKEAKGSAMQGGITRVVLQFQHYRIMTGLRLALLFHNSIKGETAAVKAASTKEFIGIMGMTGALAGTMGIPLSQTLFALLDAVLGDDDEPLDSKLVFTNWLQENLGSDAGDVATYGLPTIAGMNLSRRIGLADIYGAQNDPPAGLHGRNLAAWWAASQLGPIFSVGQGWVQGYDEIVNKGNYMKGLEVATPKPIRDVLKAYRVGTEGLKTSQGKRLLSEEAIGANEVMMLALGFNADEVAKAHSAERSLRKISTQISERRGKLVRNAARAILEGEQKSKALAAIRTFNRKMPQFAVTGSDIRPAIRKTIKGELGATGRRERAVARQFEVPIYMQ